MTTLQWTLGGGVLLALIAMSWMISRRQARRPQRRRFSPTDSTGMWLSGSAGQGDRYSDKPNRDGDSTSDDASGGGDSGGGDGGGD